MVKTCWPSTVPVKLPSSFVTDAPGSSFVVPLSLTALPFLVVPVQFATSVAESSADDSQVRLPFSS